MKDLIKNFLKKIYLIFPFKKQIFCLIKFFYKPDFSIYKHLYFHGFFKVKINNRISFYLYHTGNTLENQIFWEGIYGWEPQSIKLWINLCKNRNIKTVLDIGANTGIYSLIAKSLDNNKKVYAFEPLPKVFDFLKMNCKKNNFEININNVALSNYDGYAQIYLPEHSDFAYSVTVNKNLLPQSVLYKEMAIKVLRLDTFIIDNNIDSIDLIKLDVETHEVEVIEGMGNFLFYNRPIILIEILNQQVADSINKIFYDKDYLYYNIDESKRLLLKKHITSEKFINYVLCPIEKKIFLE
jgi:FkbM family methyltransferase